MIDNITCKGNYLIALLIFLFIIKNPLNAQITVTNGLSHFLHPNETNGEIIIQNLSREPTTVLLYFDTKNQLDSTLKIPSELTLEVMERKVVQFQWQLDDTIISHYRIYVDPLVKSIPTKIESGKISVQIKSRYAVDLYRGKLTDELNVSWVTNGVRVENASMHFWVGSCYPLIGGSRGHSRIATGVLRPSDVRIWPISEDAQGIWMERVDGNVVASLRP